MRIYRNPINNALHIWTISITGEYITKTYYYHTQKEAIKKFREEYPCYIRKLKGCKKADYCPTVLL